MKRIRPTSRYIILLCAFLLVVNTTLGYVLTRESAKAIRAQIESRMLDVANTAAAMLDGDVLRELEAEDAGTQEYQSVFRMLTHFKQHIELEYIYCLRDMGNKEFVFMIDSDPDAPGSFGEHVPYTDALYAASLGTPAVDKEPYTDSWGRFYSAYSPVFDSQDRVAGIVAVDFSADWYERQITHLAKTTLTVSAFSLVFAAVIITLITAKFRKRFRQLFNEMNLVSEGIVTLVNEVAPGTETQTPAEELPDSGDEIKALGDRMHALQDRLGEQIAFVRSQAYVDSMTGLGNRSAYEEHVRQLDDEIRAGTAEFAIELFDLNGLKVINDTLGHEEGDRTIIRAARFLAERFPDDACYRIGGDEFIVIRQCAQSEGLADGVDAQENSVSMSHGFAVFEPGRDLGFRAVFNRADTAMYEDKQAYYHAHRAR